jgi:cobalt-zinc-cadmium efflux system outer membrane protein
MVALLTLLTLAPAGDTLRFGAAEALRRAVAEAPSVQAADARQAAATSAVRTAGTWANPLFNVTAENLGAQEQVTGRPGLEGTEGQATVQQLLTLGGDRGARVREAEALAAAAGSATAIARADVLGQTVAAMALATRDTRMALAAESEAATLARLAQAMTLRAEEGRSSGGDAARARLELATVRSMAARRRAQAALSQAELGRRLGVPPGQPIVVEWPRCDAAALVPGDAAPPELEQATHDAEAARAAIDRARAARVPDLVPMAGLRRTAGYSGLLIGMSLELPLLRSGAAAEASARHLAAAAEASRADLERRLLASRAGTDSALRMVAAAGAIYDPALREDLERAARAAQARYAQGEGTLAELLDARRARLAVLNEFAEWRATLVELRARRARLAGRPLDEQVLCEDLPLEP